MSSLNWCFLNWEAIKDLGKGKETNTFPFRYCKINDYFNRRRVADKYQIMSRQEDATPFPIL